MNAAHGILSHNKIILQDNQIGTFYTMVLGDFEIFLEISKDKRKQKLLRIRNIINALETAGVDVTYGGEETKEDRGTWVQMNLDTFPIFNSIL